MKVDVQRLREDLRRQPYNTIAVQRDDLAELLAIAEAYAAAEAWYVDYRSASTLTLSSEDGGGQTVRLVRVVGEAENG